MKLLERGWKRNVRGFFMFVFIIALYYCTHLNPVCMNEHEPSELCLSIITHWSANTTEHHNSVKLLNFFFFELNKFEVIQRALISVILCPSWNSNKECRLLCFQQEWGMNCFVCHNYSGCSLIPVPHVLPTIITSCIPNSSVPSTAHTKSQCVPC